MHRLLTIWFLHYKCCRASHSDVSPAPVRHFPETFPVVSAWLCGFRVPSSLLPHGFQAMKFFISTKSSFVSPGILQVVRSLIRETLVAISWLWLLTKLRPNRLKPHSHRLLMILVFLAMILVLSVLVLNFNNCRNFGWWPFRRALYILAVLWYNWSSIGVHWQGGEQGKIGQYLAVPTIYGSLCAMWNRNSWCERHLVAGLEIHTCSVTLWQEDPREYLFLNRFEFSLQTICPANEITLFLWNYPDFSQVPCHNRVGQWVTRLKLEPVSTRLLRGSQPRSWKMCWRAPQTRVSAWNRHFVEENVWFVDNFMWSKELFNPTILLWWW